MSMSITPMPPPPVSQGAFHGISWLGFGLAVLVYCGRVTIRLMTFGRFCLEDYLMLVSLIELLAATILGQLYIGYFFEMVAVSNGSSMPSASFMDDTTKSLRTFTAVMLLNYTGIWLVKLNFLFFFRRLGNHVAKYRYLWWFVLIFNIAAGATCIGLIDFGCTLPPAEVIFSQCSTIDATMKSYTASKTSASLDAVSDALIIALPIWIVWDCKLGIRQKLALSGIFGLVAFTIAVTIIRGSIFGGTYKTIDEDNPQQLNVVWVWFWFNIEYVVAFIVGCLVSFRALYTNQSNVPSQTSIEERRRRAALQARSGSSGQFGGGLRQRARRWQDQLTTTFMTWEATTLGDSDDDRWGLPRPPTARLSLEAQAKTWGDPTSSIHELTGRDPAFSTTTSVEGNYQNSQNQDVLPC